MIKRRSSPALFCRAAVGMAVACAVMAPLSALEAADFYVTPNGAGTQTGSSWANAKPSSQLNATLNAIGGGDTLYLEGADYGGLRLTLTSSGSSSARKTLIGVDRGAGLPSFGMSSVNSNPGISIAAGCGYWTFRNLKVHHHTIGVEAAGASHPGLVFDNVSVQYSDHGFKLYDCDDLLIQNCRSEKYIRSGYFIVHSCDVVTIRNSIADSNRAVSAIDPCGFNFNSSTTPGPNNTDILLEDCISLNNYEASSSFTQGDGYMVQGANVGLTLRRCIAAGQSDAGFDLKGTNEVLEDCVASRGREGFKIWVDAAMTNCIATYCWDFGLQAMGAVTATRCTFHSSSDGAFGVRTQDSGTADLVNCLITFDAAAGTYTSSEFANTINLHTGDTANETKKHANTYNPANAPMYTNPVVKWSGAGINYNNATYGLAKGYNSRHNSEAEDWIVTGSGAAITLQNDASASGGAWMQFAGTAAGDWVEYTVPNLAAGTYAVTVYDKTYSARGKYQLSVAGANVGSVVDQYASSVAYRQVAVGNAVVTVSGPQVFRFTITGKNAASSGYSQSTDAIVLTQLEPPGEGVEAESLTRTTSGQAATVQTYDPMASGGAWVSFSGAAAGNWIELAMPAIAGGTYEVKVLDKSYTNRGQYQMSLSGFNVGGVVDQYESLANYGYRTVVLGKHVFTAGAKQARFTVVGKNASSTGYGLSLDSVVLIPTEFEAEALTSTNSGVGTTVYTDDAAARGGSWLALNATAVNDWIEFTVPNIAPGTYTVKVRDKTYTNRGRYQLTVNGVNIGSPVDQYAATSYRQVTVGNVTVASGGSQTFRFTVTGKNASSTGYVLTMDSILLTQP